MSCSESISGVGRGGKNFGRQLSQARRSRPGIRDGATICGPMDIPDQLRKLQDLREAGALSDEEFARAKAAVLGGSAPPAWPPASREQQTRQWALLLHLSLLAGLLIPLAGLVIPILIWQLKKDDLPGLEPHGRVVANWIISEIIYGVACGVLILLVIGIPLLMALLAIGIVFPIIGAIKANDGVVWKYPLSIPFLP